MADTMHKATEAVKNLHMERPGAQPVQGASRSTTEAPGSFYGGSIGRLRSKESPEVHRNEAGLPSTGREDAVLGCTAASQYAKDPRSVQPARHVFNEFSLSQRVAMVTGAAGGLGLEMALGLVEAGAIVYCVDLAPEETDTFKEARDYAAGFGGVMHYINGNVVSITLVSSVISFYPGFSLPALPVTSRSAGSRAGHICRTIFWDTALTFI